MNVSAGKEKPMQRDYHNHTYIYLAKQFKFYLLAIGLIAHLSILIYQNSFRAGFQFDDFKAIVENASIRDIRNIPLIFRILAP